MEHMNYGEFLMALECIGLKYDLRLVIHRAPVGCGFHFCFRDDELGGYSRGVVFILNHTEPEELFKQLEDLAIEFSEHNKAFKSRIQDLRRGYDAIQEET